MSQDENIKPSRLKSHLMLLGLEGGPADQQSLDKESELIDQMRPKPLNLPNTGAVKQRRPKWVVGGAVALAAAACVLLIVRYETRDMPPPAWAIKGSETVEVFVERGGNVQPLAEVQPVVSGDRLKAEVLVIDPTVAFWAVSNREGKLLNETSWVWRRRLEMPAGGKASFSGSLEIEGASEGEVLHVALCPMSVGQEGESAFMTHAEAMFGASRDMPDPWRACNTRQFPLRK